MQRKQMTPEKVEQEMRERLKLLGRDDLDYEEEKARERMNKEKK